MDLEKLKNAGKALPNEEFVKQLIARFPNEKDEFTNTLTSLNMVPCTKELFSENGIHAISKAYNFGIMFLSKKKPTDVYIDTGEMYYYILKEAEKTITQQPRYGEAQARYYKIADAFSITSNDEYMTLSDTVTFKSTTLSVSDEDIEEFKKYVVKHKHFGINLVSDKYNEYVVIRNALDKLYKPFVDNIPEKIITTDHHYVSGHLENTMYFCYYSLYLEGSSIGMNLLAQDELETKKEEIFGKLDSKQITETILSTFENRNLGDDIENLLYEFFTENPQAKNEPEFNLTFGVYFDEEDDGNLDDVITSKFDGLNLIVNTQPIKVVGAISKKDYLGADFSTFYNWNLFKINIPEVTIPVSQNVIDYYVKKHVNFVHWAESGTVLDFFIHERMYEVIKPKLLESKIKITSGYYFYADIFRNFNCQAITLTIKNPIFQEND